MMGSGRRLLLSAVALADVGKIVEWDGVERSIPVWNRDHDLRSGIEFSAVWMYQQLARQVGEERMAQMVDAAGYGNADTGGGIDRFWLTGDLRISPVEQVEFLVRLVEGEVPFDDDHVAAVRDIIVRERGDDWTWSHKTGTSLDEDPDLGWLVGTTEYRGSTWVFALNLDLEPVGDLGGQLDPHVRQSIAREILVGEGALPPE